MDAVLVCLAICFHFSWPSLYILYTSWFREIFSFMLLRGIGCTVPRQQLGTRSHIELLMKTPIMHFWHWISSQFSYQDWWGRSTGSIDSVKRITFTTTPRPVHSPITDVLATYDPEIPSWIPYFCNHQMSCMRSAFTKTPWWLGWPQLTNSSRLCNGLRAIICWLFPSPPLTLAGGWLLC